MIDSLLPDTLLRVRIHTMRVRIEQIAAHAVATVTKQPPEQNQAGARLIVLAHECSEYAWADSYRVVRLSRHCYKRTSDVLHGRSSMVSVTSSIVDEWDQIVQDLEALYADWLICHGDAHADPEPAPDEAEIGPT